MTEGAKGLNAFQNLDHIYTDIAISTDWLILQGMSKLCQAPLLIHLLRLWDEWDSLKHLD